jgi:isopentenyl-diphosphate delta-isomerase
LWESQSETDSIIVVATDISGRNMSPKQSIHRPAQLLDEYLWAIDSRGKVFGKRTRAESHKQGIIHRAVHVVVLDPRRRIFVKKRSQSKDMFPRQWETSVGGHVTYGDNTAKTAARELEEELGIIETPIYLTRFRYRGKEEKENIVFFYVLTKKKPKLNRSEATMGEFITFSELEKTLSQRTFVNGTVDELLIIRKLLSKLQEPSRLRVSKKRQTADY